MSVIFFWFEVFFTAEHFCVTLFCSCLCFIFQETNTSMTVSWKAWPNLCWIYLLLGSTGGQHRYFKWLVIEIQVWQYSNITWKIIYVYFGLFLVSQYLTHNWSNLQIQYYLQIKSEMWGETSGRVILSVHHITSHLRFLITDINHYPWCWCEEKNTTNQLLSSKYKQYCSWWLSFTPIKNQQNKTTALCNIYTPNTNI